MVKTLDHGLGRREVVALSVFYFLFFGALGFLLTFVPVFLKARGLSLSEIAILLAVNAAVGGLTQVSIGHISDLLGSRKQLGALCCVLLGISYICFVYAHSLWAFALLFAWSGVTFLGGFTIPQAIISDWTSAEGSTARGFSATRIWGTIGFIASLLLVTRWPGIARGNAFLYAGGWLYILSALPLLALREAPVHRATRNIFKDAKAVLVSQRAYMFLICYALYRLCESGVLGFLNLYLKSLGADERVIAAAYMINAVAEIPFVLTIGFVSDKIGRKVLLIISFAALAIRLYLYSLISVPTAVYYIQLLHGLTFGIVVIVSVAYMSDVAPPNLHGTAQGLLSVFNAIAMTLSPLLVGFIGEAIGLRPTFQIMAAIMALAFVLLTVFVKEPGTSRKLKVESE